MTIGPALMSCELWHAAEHAEPLFELIFGTAVPKPRHSACRLVSSLGAHEEQPSWPVRPTASNPAQGLRGCRNWQHLAIEATEGLRGGRCLRGTIVLFGGADATPLRWMPRDDTSSPRSGSCRGVEGG